MKYIYQGIQTEGAVTAEHYLPSDPKTSHQAKGHGKKLDPRSANGCCREVRSPEQEGKGTKGYTDPRMAQGEPHLAILYCCSEGSRGLSQLVWPPTQKWNPPAAGSEYQIPPGENRRPLCRSHYCCQEEHPSSDSPAMGRLTVVWKAT